MNPSMTSFSQSPCRLQSVSDKSPKSSRVRAEIQTSWLVSLCPSHPLPMPCSVRVAAKGSWLPFPGRLPSPAEGPPGRAACGQRLDCAGHWCGPCLRWDGSGAWLTLWTPALRAQPGWALSPPPSSASPSSKGSPEPPLTKRVCPQPCSSLCFQRPPLPQTSPA